MKQNNKDYYLGLDIGTNSVGWAVTDADYNILRLKGKRAWGVRLFDEAATAAERRNFRSNRRRKKRHEWRLELIRQLFESEINKVDENFYIRMKNSPYYLEDKDIKDKYALFSSKDFTDIDYYRKYPTIYHLRKELMSSKEPHDVRLVFLAVYHIVKHRGHFLWNVDYNATDEVETEDSYENLIESIIKNTGIELIDEQESIKEILISKRTKNDKKKDIKNIIKSIKVDTDEGNFAADCLFDVFCLVIGSKVNVKKFVGTDDEVDEEGKKMELRFDCVNINEQMEEVGELIDDGWFEIIENAKDYHDRLKLEKIIGEHKTISDAKIYAYEKHKNDLKMLKKIIKQHCPKKYDDVFRNHTENNYVAYSGKSMVAKNKKYIKKCSKEEFYKFINKILEIVSDERVEIIKTDMENSDFLPLERWSDNGVIPNQLHRNELIKILDNAKNYLKFLNDKDKDGKTTYDKILATFDFRIPYYIGPLNDYHKTEDKLHGKKGAWVTFLNNKTKLYPWNYLEQIDIEKTHADFILRMTNKCTYMPKYDVVPKNSLLYQEYMVLNEINILKINGARLNDGVKQAILELFHKTKKVTLSKIIDCLISEGYYAYGEINKDSFTGINKGKDIVSSLTTYHKFKEYFGDKVNNDSVKKVIEGIVRYITIYGDDENASRSRIEKDYIDELKGVLGEDYGKTLKKICKLRFVGWGKFSREFLNLEGIEKETGEKNTIINFLRNRTLSLMELIATDNYTFIETLALENNNVITELEYDLVDELYVSPSVKRAIWQVIKLVKELIYIIGKEPQKIFIEMARADEEKKETTSRKNALLRLYESLKDDEYLELKERLENEEDANLRRKDLFLYYTQLGKDIYTEEPINIAELYNNKVYDIDHIYPRSKSGQDSITKNLVLTNRKSNASIKGDKYPIPSEIQNRMDGFWKMLRQKNLITAEKYERLVRKTDFTDDELAGFIDRQLVETRQSTKVVKDILKSYFGEKSKIIAVHANLVTKFRNGENMKKNTDGETEKYTEFPKVRLVNDFHHAKDAYLNIVVGNVYNTKFTNNPKEWIKSNRENREKYSLNWVFAKDVDSAWKAGENGTIKTIENYMNKNDVIITVQQYENKGELFNQQLEPSNKNLNKTKATTCLKENGKLNSIEKYGGYTGVKPCYFVIYKYDETEEYTKNGKENIIKRTKYEFKQILLKDVLRIRNSKEYNLSANQNKFEQDKIKELLINNLYENNSKNSKIEFQNLELIKSKILINTVVVINGYKYYIRGEKELGSAEQLILSKDIEKYIKTINKYVNSIENYYKGKDVPIDKIIGIAEKFQTNKANNLKVFEELLLKYRDSVYAKRVANPYDKLKVKKEVFENLNIYEQSKILIELLKNFSCKVTQRSNLSLLNLPSDVGRLTATHNLNKEKMIILNYSVTGLYCDKECINGMADS